MVINLGSMMGNRSGEVVNALNLQKNQILDLSMVSKEKYEKIADYAKYVLQQDNKDID